MHLSLTCTHFPSPGAVAFGRPLPALHSQATTGQREAEKHTNKRQIYDQPDFCLQVRPRAVNKEKDSLVKGVSFQVL